MLIGHRRSSSADTNLLITKTAVNAEEVASPTPSKPLPEERPPEIETTIYELKPKPLLTCLTQYSQFLDSLRHAYTLIMKQCAPKISKHFTRLTSVIVDNLQYEFPSAEIHQAVISKLILNDMKYFKQLVGHVQREFAVHEEHLRAHHRGFTQSIDRFSKEVEEDILADATKIVKIEVYMRDLRKHALKEYDDLYREEQE